MSVQWPDWRDVRPLLVVLVLMFAAFALLAGADVSHAMQDQVVTTRPASTLDALLELFKVAGGVIGMFGVALGIYGGWLAFQAAKTKAHIANAEKTAQIYEDQNKAMQQQLLAKDQDYRLLAEKTLTLENECITLRGKTDITGVLTIIEQLQKTGNDRWNIAMELLGNQNKAQLEATANNYKQLCLLGENITKLTKRFTAVENMVNEASEDRHGESHGWTGRDRRKPQADFTKLPDGKERRRIG